MGKSQILKALPNLIIDISSPDGTDAAAKAEKPPEAGGDGGVGSTGRIFTPDSKLVYVNVYSTAPDAEPPLQQAGAMGIGDFEGQSRRRNPATQGRRPGGRGPPFFDISTDVDGHPATMIVLKPLPGWSTAIAIEALEKDLEELKAAAFPRGMNFEVIPLDSRDMIYAVVEAPRYSTLEYTSTMCHGLGAIARGIDGITSVSSLAGYELRTEDRDSTAGTCLIHLKDRSDRKLTSRQIIETLEEKCRTMNVASRFLRAARGFGLRRGRGFLRTRPGQNELEQRQAPRKWGRDVHG